MDTKYWDNIDLELSEEIRTMPIVPSKRILVLLSTAAYSIPDHIKDKGKELQRKHGLEKIPPVAEMEWAAGLWSLIREAIKAQTPRGNDNG